MAEIEVKRQGPETFAVRVTANVTTDHTVTLTPDYYQKLTEGNVSPEQLIKRSFEFLLERETNSCILSRFDLPVIARYFPEFEKTIVGRL